MFTSSVVLSTPGWLPEASRFPEGGAIASVSGFSQTLFAEGSPYWALPLPPDLKMHTKSQSGERYGFRTWGACGPSTPRYGAPKQELCSFNAL